MEPTTIEKIVEIDKHIGMSTANKCINKFNIYILLFKTRLCCQWSDGGFQNNG